ncbi:MAG TPA: pyridoxal-phosphate dependent enzyme [Rhodopila sp.]
MQPEYLDPRSGATFPLARPRWCGTDQAPLLLTPLPGLTRDQIDTATRSLWRYRVALPFPVDDPITLGEGMTPLIARTVAGVRVLLKCEWFNPTCSFKDRGASVMLSLLRAQGVEHVLEDSSGNGGASVAAYAAAGGLRATILTPASTSPAKLVQMRAHGAAVELIAGSRQNTADAAVARSELIFYASHNWHPFFLQGTKTLAYELWEDLGFRPPDNIIVPCGAGSNVLGCEIGFSELLRSGQIACLPRVFAAQPANCAPVAAAFMALSDVALPAGALPAGALPAGALPAGPLPAGALPAGPLSDARVETTILPTMAEGTAIARPVRLREVLGTLRETRGGAVTLTEKEIAEATLDLARIGIYVEPTCAQVAAAFGKLLETGTITPDQTTVLVMTGTGLKATPRIAGLLGIAL